MDRANLDFKYCEVWFQFSMDIFFLLRSKTNIRFMVQSLGQFVQLLFPPLIRILSLQVALIFFHRDLSCNSKLQLTTMSLRPAIQFLGEVSIKI